MGIRLMLCFVGIFFTCHRTIFYERLKKCGINGRGEWVLSI